MADVISARAALERLREGNQRFVANVRSLDAAPSRSRRAELVAGQAPFAIILGCSDSRVPAEMIFDQGLGDLFVIRVAGNIVARSQIASVEFAVARFSTPLVVVLGHTQCGAIEATFEALRSQSSASEPNLRYIVERIRPAVEPLLPADDDADMSALLQRAMRANARASVEQLRHGSPVLERAIRDGGLVIVGGEYSLESGRVEFFDESSHAAGQST